MSKVSVIIPIRRAHASTTRITGIRRASGRQNAEPVPSRRLLGGRYLKAIASAKSDDAMGRIVRAYREVDRISDLVSFEPDVVSLQLDGTQLCLEPGQTVIPHRPARDLTIDEVLPRKQP